jgi:outer membrane protein OmpA-like peptidoglycan-associated protein
MTLRIIALTLLMVTSFSGTALAAAAKAVAPELQPPPYVEIMPQYSIDDNNILNKNIEFDAYTFNTGKNQTEEVEGRIWQRRCSMKRGLPQNPSALQVFRNYANLLRSMGVTNVVELRGDEVAKKLYSGSHLRVVSGKFVRDGKEVWVEMQVDDGARDYLLTVLETDKFVQEVAEAPTADEMLRALRDKGHVTLYINFDTAKWDIKPESLPIIEQIAAMLKSAADLRLSIEGHTDSVGSAASNKTLSDNRARSVMQAITARGIAANRLSAVGWGQEKPIADNSTDAGRAKNRRVELVRVQSPTSAAPSPTPAPAVAPAPAATSTPAAGLSDLLGFSASAPDGLVGVWESLPGGGIIPMTSLVSQRLNANFI